MYKVLQEQIQPRMLMGLLVSIILMALLSSYLYVIKQPFNGFRQQQQTLTLLQDEVTTGIPLQNRIKSQQQLVKQLNTKLHGAGAEDLPTNKMVPHIIGALDKIANRHKVNLASVKPQNTESLFTFREVPFQIEISGEYFNLFAWLRDVENELGPIVIKQFDISSIAQSNDRRMILTIASYQFEDKK